MKAQAPGAAQGQRAWAAQGAEADALLQLARWSQPGVVDGSGEHQFLSAFHEHVAAQQEPSRWSRAAGWWRYGVAFAAALAVALTVLQTGALSGRSALTYQIESGERQTGRLVTAAQTPIALDFSDGTTVTLEPNSSTHVAETRQGARFRLRSGKLAFNVVPRADHGDWIVDVGQFQVHVVGTIFTVERSTTEGSLRVDVTRGQVVVEGVGQRRELGPGDSFHHREHTAGNLPARVGRAAR